MDCNRSTPLSLTYIFLPDRQFPSERCKAKHFVNHHSFLHLFEKGFCFDRKLGEFFVDGLLLKFALTCLGIEHIYMPGGLYLTEKLKNTAPEECFFALPSDATAYALHQMGYLKAIVLPIVSNENLLELAREIVEAATGKLVIMGIGSPNQDLLAQKVVELDSQLDVICVGAAVEFLAGTQKSPPSFVRKSGLEWMWRLTTNFRVTLPRVTSSVVGFFELFITKKVTQ